MVFNYAVISFNRFLLNSMLKGYASRKDINLPKRFLYTFEARMTLPRPVSYLVSFCTLCRDFGVSWASSCARMDSLNREPPDEFIPGEADDANDGRGRPPFDIS